jgi:hypothetical protein
VRCVVLGLAGLEVWVTDHCNYKLHGDRSSVSLLRFRSCCGFPNFAPNPLSGLGRSINAIVVAAWMISSVAPAARDTAEPGRSSAHHKIMIHVSGDTNHNQRGRDVASPVRCGLRATAARASHGTLNTAVLHRKGF